MQTRHLVANDLGNDRGNFGIGILVRTAESNETVTALFTQGTVREINVSMDSGSAMIRDILRALV